MHWEERLDSPQIQQASQGPPSLSKILPLTSLTQDNLEKKKLDMAMVTLYQTITQKQEKDMELKVAADKDSNNWILQT